MRVQLVALDALVDPRGEAVTTDAEVPEWVRLVPSGVFKTTKGTFRADAESWAQIAHNAAERGVDTVIDFDHASLTVGADASAAGWVVGTEVRDDGLWGRVEWTERGALAIAKRSYRYFSPVIDIDPRSGRVVRLDSGALTNRPAILGQTPIAASRGIDEDGNMDLRTKLLALLALSATATDEDVLAAVETKVALSATTDKVCAALGATPDTVVQVALSSKVRADAIDPKEFQAIKAQLAEDRANRVIEVALSEGKLTPANQAWAKKYALSDPEGFEEFIKAAPVVTVPLNRQAPRVGPEGRASEPDTAVLAEVKRQLGISDEEWKAHNG